MALLKLAPCFKDYLWGGRRLVEEYNKQYSGEILAESWELSCHPDGPSVIINGQYAGKTLQEYIDTEGKDVLGENCRRFKEFPILTKFIDAKDNLSIQVHPDNRYALKNEGQYGKTEMWYVMDAGEDAYLYYGFKQEISREEFARRIEEDTLLDVLNSVRVQKGDVLFIEAGTIHAIGKDILIAEIQQNSNITYRVYDYGRTGKDGKKRDLHIEKALAVTNRVPIVKSKTSYPHIADCDYFTVDKLNLDGQMMRKMEGNVTAKSFINILFLDGEGKIICADETVAYKKGDSIFLSAGSGAYQIEGSCDALITSIRSKAAPVRIGIDMGGTTTRIGLVDIHHKLLASRVIPTLAENGPESVLNRIAAAVLNLLEEEKIPLDQCVGVGMGIPGTVDPKSGKLRYSNNIKWENIEVLRIMGSFLPLPIKIANNADCATLGEAIAGAGKDSRNIVMLTLGTGVGGGIILDGKIYTGRIMGGSELGHMVIAGDGELCTCGRRGCLEAYVSATALAHETAKTYGEVIPPERLFSLAAEGDSTARRITDHYTEMLGIGIVNIVNIFRPELVLLGGNITAQKDVLLKHLCKIMEQKCFGGKHGDIPEIRAAALGSDAGMIGAANLL